ncbi:hypothetical protein CARUB_v10014892mg [Capsella rubella]|uniref:CR-type domain-containing protein n=1 Tax=Capsella rubella TaxID=81985 RepID=R0I5P4_9BRAS|nr:protein disulfide isomerase pTAC5, chloroplastic [Capsella rubella]EOA31688.1 hypothetical protein CARUB_v10014892mg [Capsella rubella]
MAANACLPSPAAMTVRPEEGVPNSKSTQSQPRLYLTKPSWIVRTQSGVKACTKRKEKDRCVICHGTGRVDCFNCRGKGRTNCVDEEMLPKGQWPKWCKGCGGSGLSDCSRCLGTGEYRYIMGFRFLKQDDDVDPP